MTESDNSKRREDKAIQALISASLHQDEADVTEEELKPYLRGNIHLTPEDEAALKAKKSKSHSASSAIASENVFDAVESEEFMALNRKQPELGFSQKTEDEVKRKREALIAELRKRKKGNV